MRSKRCWKCWTPPPLAVSRRRLPVSNAFHSRLVAPAADQLRTTSPVPETAALTCQLISSMTGRPVEAGRNLREHFAAQVTAQVDFVGMVETMAAECDQLIEVGPGRVLSGLVADIHGETGPTCLPVAAQPDADRNLNLVLARAFTQGVDVNWPAPLRGPPGASVSPRAGACFHRQSLRASFPRTAIRAAACHWSRALESFLVESTGADSAQMRDYLARRQGFLANVIQADIHSLNGSLMKLPTEHSAPVLAPVTRLRAVAALPDAPQPEPSTASPAIVPTPAPAADLEELLLDLAAKRRGPRDTITMEVRLLDDLNLDSIKAAELVAAAAKQMGTAGKVDPSKLANATLAEVAAAIREVAGPDAPRSAIVVPAADTPVLAPAGLPGVVLDDSPNSVRNFAIDFVEAA